MNRRLVLKGLGVAAGVVALAPVVSSASVVVIDAVQARKNAAFAAANYVPSTAPSATLVAYYSRSGNTALMGLEMAKALQAPTLALHDETFPIGVTGWVNALRHAGETDAAVSPASIGLTPYATVFIGAPVWLYSPAPPAWAFVRRNDFTGKRVILFNSLNSRFEQAHIDRFADLVRQQGGTFATHLYVVRGRMTRQLATTDFLAEVRQQLTML